MAETLTLAEFEALVGKEYGLSRWYEMDQKRIDAFADITEDWQFIHVDADAAKQTPFGGTIAHGFLTLSLLSAMVYEAGPRLKGIAMGVNYGFDKIRFRSPGRAGSRVRGKFTLMELSEGRPGEITYKQAVSVEIEGSDKPALIAEWIGRVYMEPSK